MDITTEVASDINHEVRNSADPSWPGSTIFPIVAISPIPYCIGWNSILNKATNTMEFK